MSDVCLGAGGLEGQACWPEYGPALVYAGKAEQDAEHGGVTKAGAFATRNDDCCVFASVVLLVIAIAHSKQRQQQTMGAAQTETCRFLGLGFRVFVPNIGTVLTAARHECCGCAIDMFLLLGLQPASSYITVVAFVLSSLIEPMLTMT